MSVRWESSESEDTEESKQGKTEEEEKRSSEGSVLKLSIVSKEPMVSHFIL